MNACHQAAAEEPDQRGSAGVKEEREVEGSRSMEGRGRAGHKGVEEGQRNDAKQAQEQEGCVQSTEAGAGAGAEAEEVHKQHQDYVPGGKSDIVHHDARESVAFGGRAAASESRRGVTGGTRFVRGDDLREKKWGNLVR